MWKILSLLLLMLTGFLSFSVFGDLAYRDIYPDTWVAKDALGRTMPGISQTGPLKKDHRRVVGMFYITWHVDSMADLSNPYTADVTKILLADPNARFNAQSPLWSEYYYHWGEPELGYFLSKDKFVISRDISMLADAGVDVLILDVTNAQLYWDQWQVLFETMQKMRAQGNKVPQFCFWAFNGPVITVVQKLYDRIYKTHKYKDLWFYWDSKPLLLYNGTPNIDATGKDIKHPNPNYDIAAVSDPNHPHYGNPYYTKRYYQDYTDEVKKFFTLRTMWWGYYKWNNKRFVGTEGNWSFGYDFYEKKVRDMDPDDLISNYNGTKEQAAVTAAQHAISMIGKSWSRANGQPMLDKYDLPLPSYVPWLGKTVKNPEAYGIYFQERWNEAIESNPHFIYVNDWNEWTAIRFTPEKLPEQIKYKDKNLFDFMGRPSPFLFVDQYNSEFNRGIQPMKGGYTDNYYMQMAQNVRRYKGVRPIPRLKGYNKINIDGNFNDWQEISVEYRDTVGDTVHRDYPGYGGLYYTNESGRNDITTCKVAVDKDMIYFYANAQKPLTAHTGDNWMLLLLDSDNNHSTGWYGYDYLINKKIVNENQTLVMKYTADNPSLPWAEIAKINYHYQSGSIELAVPRKILGLNGNNFILDYKWADNPIELKDPISFCTDGDSAPNRRFNYRLIWKLK